MPHFLKLKDIPAADLRGILDAAHKRKAARNANLPKSAQDKDAPLKDHLLAMIFDKPSTRTRLSFELAIRQLGGAALILNRADAQFGRGETFGDTAAVVSRFADVIMLRTTEHAHIEELAAAASVPVINGLTNDAHPCQIIADLQTFEEHKGAVAGKRLAWIGDGNNVAASLAEASTAFNFELALACPPEFSLPAELIAACPNLVICATAQEAAKGASAVLTDCWVSMGDDEASRAKRAAAFAPYQITPEIMALGDDAIFMHCLPAYRGQEVAASVIDGARSVVFDEAENRNHAQKAILLYALSK